MTDKEKELIEQILDKVKSIHTNLNDFRNETRSHFSIIKKRLDKMLEHNEETNQSLERILKNLER